MKIWIIAGESSGDLYGARISRELKALNPELEISGMGGQHMQAEGLKLMVDSSELGVVGLFEVLKHYPTFRRIFNDLVKAAAEQRPDAVVLIDYPGFNLRYAEKLDKLNIPVIYYVSPQVWAWGKKRIPKIARLVTKMMVIFPFEVETYSHTDLDVEFVGHPLAEILSETPRPEKRDDKTILLLPGSRSSEIKRLLKPMLETASRLKKQDNALQFVIPTPRKKIADIVSEKIIQFGYNKADFKVDSGNTAEWMVKASCGLASSGTVTVQAAILGLPLVSCYKLNPLTFILARMLVKIDFFTMPNVIAKKEIFEEFLQSEVKADILSPALERIFPEGSRRQTVEQGMSEVVEKLGGRSGSLKRAAEVILETISEK